MRKIIWMVFIVCLLSSSIVYGETQRFKDVPSNHYAYEGIVNIAEKCKIVGDGSGKFYPDREIKGQEFWLMMNNLYDSYRVESGKDSLRENDYYKFCFKYESAPFQSFNLLGLSESKEWNLGMSIYRKVPRWVLWKTAAKITGWSPEYYLDGGIYDSNKEIIENVKNEGIYKKFPDPYGTPTRGEVMWFINKVKDLRREEKLEIYGIPIKVRNWDRPEVNYSNYYELDEIEDKSCLYLDMYVDKNIEWYYVHSLVYALNQLPEKYVKQFVEDGWCIKVTRNIGEYYRYTIGKINLYYGLTIPEYKTIWVSTIDGELHLSNVIYHEFGHYVSDLMPDEDKYLIDMYKEKDNDKSNLEGRVLRSYARVNPDEFFADSFSYIIRSRMKEEFKDDSWNILNIENFKKIYPKTYSYIEGCWIDGKELCNVEQAERVYER